MPKINAGLLYYTTLEDIIHTKYNRRNPAMLSIKWG